MKITQVESVSGLTHILDPHQKGLGAIGKHPQFKTRWALAYSGEGHRIEFESPSYPTKAAAVAEVVRRHGAAMEGCEVPPPVISNEDAQGAFDL